MKTEFALDEIRRLIKRNEKDNRLKLILLAVTGAAVVVGAVVIILSKLKSKESYTYDDWSELDDMDYDDYDFDDDDFDCVYEVEDDTDEFEGEEE